ncbi:MAG: TrmH family RNA methyltransferase [Acidimicrobiia bacterium]
MEYVNADVMFELVHGRPTDDPTWFQFGDRQISPNDVVALLGPRISESRRATIDDVLRQRTDNLTVVVEGMVDLGNVSAVMRSADGFGVQSIHAIDTANVYKRSRRTTRGTDKWLDRYRWDDPEACFAHLRGAGYSIVIAEPGDGTPVYDVDLSHRIALVFGNELEGLSDVARRFADVTTTIPMSGFGESFNISVAASVILSEVVRQRTERFGSNGDLNEETTNRIRAVWYMKSVREARLFLERAIDDGYRFESTT